MSDPTPRDTLIKSGETAPDFTLATQDRQDWSLSEAVKKSDVVLCFFPFAFTGVCSKEMGCVSRDMDDWKAKGAEVVGISCDSFAALKAWAGQESLAHTLLSDLHRTTCRSFGLYWADMNVCQRGTVVIAQSDDGVAKVKWSQAREPGNAMDFNEVLACIA